MAFCTPTFEPNRHMALVARSTAATIFIASAASAQTGGTLKPVTIHERSAAPQADIGGFGDLPLNEVPISTTVVDREQMQASGARRLADLTQFDASVTDSYNSPGYWDFLTVRGFVLDNRYNYRREGLPISAETSIPLENKERVEILKGTSGIQAGTSAPGGLVNYVVKRPTQHDLRELRVEFSSRASVLAAVDLGGRFGVDQAMGYRLNVAHENMRPLTRNLDGSRSLVALATDWRLGPDSVLEAEIEWSHKTQPSQNGFSLLGNVLPAPVDPRLNLNNQPWSQPSVFDAVSGSVRFEQALGRDWRWSAQLGSQRLRTDDRIAFSFGCSAEGNFDRFCSDGTLDLYDFRSENERRRQQAANLSLKGKLATGSATHDLAFGLQASQLRNRFQMQAFNLVGTGNVAGTAITPADPTLTAQNTNRDERSLEFLVQDAIRWSERFTTWLGLRHTRLSRDSVSTDGSSPTSHERSISTPWLAASYQITPGQLYASYGEGVESEVAPALPIYANAGQPLPSLKSRQTELGIRDETQSLRWSAALFQIKRPLFADVGACSAVNTCTRQLDGEVRNRGLELSAGWREGPWRLDSGLTLMDARRQASTAAPALNGKRPTNMPDWVLRAQAA